MNAMNIRTETVADRDAVHALLRTAFGGDDEARLVQSLHADGDVVLSLVAETEGTVCGHVLFSRLHVINGDARFPAVALAPLAVSPALQRQGIAARLVEEAHQRLIDGGETLSVVLGEPAYYGRFGYRHEDATNFESDYQCEALQAVQWGNDAPSTGKLVYAPAFGGL
ncbi:N-acetyltransferase GCN5 [Nitratireductor aquibiodomus RA22]|uniref:N-acetyltransferase GCN5 n=1 Tax=Nitratireductor aquibiodomus RA22 TaxID=1189611 RepID=I5BU76_9HYPH|nr:N-acetyltransferase [Nitratireductor aquibiodomus]EIM73128.1 N-acetyltransferase GCN5 [Nitratireductor aquibiodomus RA22]